MVDLDVWKTIWWYFTFLLSSGALLFKILSTSCSFTDEITICLYKCSQYQRTQWPSSTNRRSWIRWQMKVLYSSFPLSHCIFWACSLVNVSVSWQQTSDTYLLLWSHHVPADCSWCQLSRKAVERILPAYFSLKYGVSVLWGFKYFRQSPKSSKRMFYKDTANLSH